MKYFPPLAFLCLLAFSFSCKESSSPVRKWSFAQNDDYKLTKVIAVSRHNVRAPLQKNIDSAKGNVSDPSVLKDFTDLGSHLTLRGAALETIFGGYFRAWLRSKGLLEDCVIDSIVDNKYTSRPDTVTHDIIPDISRFYFGASPRERTVASARAFATGFLPTVDVSIDFTGFTGPESLDRNYLPFLVQNTDTNTFKTVSSKEIQCIIARKKTDLEHSLQVLKKEVGFMDTFKGDIDVNLDFYRAGKQIKEPDTSGLLKAANQISDALILQYYVLGDASITGKPTAYQDWYAIAKIKDIYSEILFTAPLVAINTSHGLLGKVREGMQDKRDFTFLCTHDTSISALLAALGVKSYELPCETTIESLTPNGCKLLIEQYVHGKDTLAKVRMMYQTNEQIQNLTVLDYKKGPHPATFDLCFEHMTSQDGFYKWSDLEKRIEDTWKAFYR